MMSKRDITKIVRRILRQQRGIHEHQLIHPRREWAIGLLVGFLCLAGGGIWSYLTFQDVSKRDVTSINAVTIEQNVYQENVVNTALGTFEKRKEKYQAMLQVAQSIEPEVIEEATVEVEDNVASETVVENVTTDTEEAGEPQVVEEAEELVEDIQ